MYGVKHAHSREYVVAESTHVCTRERVLSLSDYAAEYASSRGYVCNRE